MPNIMEVCPVEGVASKYLSCRGKINIDFYVAIKKDSKKSGNQRVEVTR